jgi:hypothetical protein
MADKCKGGGVSRADNDTCQWPFTFDGIKELSVPDNDFITARPTITIIVTSTAAGLPDAIPRVKRGKVPR